MIPLFTPDFDESDVEAVVAAIRSGWLNEHCRTREFEKEFADYVGTKYAVATTSGTVALFLALKAAGVTRRSLVAVPDFTAIGTVRAVQLAGGRAVLFDVDEYGNINVDDVCKSMVSHVVVVHNNGHPCDLEKLVEHFGSRYVIEDACQTLGSKPYGQQMGTDTDLGCFSLSPTKIITAGQGGVVVTDDEKLCTHLQRLKNQGNYRGVDPADTYPTLGYNFKWTEMNAALALSQLKRLDQRVESMWNIYGEYVFRIGKHMPKLHMEELPWCVTANVSSEIRDDVVKYMQENGVDARAFSKPLHMHLGVDGCPHATEYASRGIYLPSSPTLINKQIEYVCSTFMEAIK